MSCSYKFGSLLGKGSYGVVYNVQDSSGNNYAMKITKSLGDIQFMEMNLLKSSNHPNVSKAKYLITNGTCETHKGIGYVSELALTDLYDYLSQEEYPITFENRLKIAWDIANGLRHLHDNNFLHLDLKPENILIYGSYDNPTAVISDFGLSSLIEQDKNDKDLGSVRITANFRPPENFAHESFDHRSYGKYSDIWSLGIIYILLFGNFPNFSEDYTVMNSITPKGYYPAIFQELVSKSKLSKFSTLSNVQKLGLKNGDVFIKSEEDYYYDLISVMTNKEIDILLLNQPNIDYSKLSKVRSSYVQSEYTDDTELREYLLELILQNRKNIPPQDKWKHLPRTSYEDNIMELLSKASPTYYKEVLDVMDEDDLLGYARGQPLISLHELDRILLLPGASRGKELKNYLYSIMLSQSIQDLLLLIKGMLVSDKNKRLSILDVLSHNFFVNLGYTNSISNNMLIPDRYSLKTKGMKDEYEILAIIKETALAIKDIYINVPIRLRTFFLVMDIYYRSFTYISFVGLRDSRTKIRLIMLAAIYIGLGMMDQPYVIDDIAKAGNDIFDDGTLNNENLSMMVKMLCQEFNGVFYREYLWERANTMEDIENILNDVMYDPIAYIDIDLDAYFGKIIKSDSTSDKKEDTYVYNVKFFNDVMLEL